MPEPFDLPLGGWWRFDRYELSDGYIRPADGATLAWYDPWTAYRQSWSKEAWGNQELVDTCWGDRRKQFSPYGSLLDVVTNLTGIPSPKGSLVCFMSERTSGHRYELTPESEKLILGFCTQNGLLGILPQRVHIVFLAPRFELELGNTLRPTQRSYVRVPTGWSSSFNLQIGEGAVVLLNQPERRREVVSEEYLEKSYVKPNVLLQSLGKLEFNQESLGKTWAEFFPTVPEDERETYQYPAPLSEDFWRLYAEPVHEFLNGARILWEALERLKHVQPPEVVADENDNWNVERGTDILHALLAPVGLALNASENGTFHQRWATPSLLASFATMAFLDLTEGRLLRCRRCRKIFTSDAYHRAYCSDRCRNAAQKQRHRERHPDKAKAQQKRDYQFRTGTRKTKGQGKPRGSRRLSTDRPPTS